MLRLASETDAGWVQGVEGDLDTLLVDHAHCEKKAASTAINLIFRYQDHAQLMRPLSEVAREELEHFELVLGVLEQRGASFRPLSPSPYASQLYTAVRKPEPDRLLDTLLVCALVEARSCERMRLLAEQLTDPALASLYEGLLTSEARHHALYVNLAIDAFGRDATLPRLAALADHEASVLTQMPEEVRVHSRAPA
ncbi:MAG: tRNA-(ms[2]io[6]A)-hydroxylase [Myxococcales bacterium]|nr:tRNA-(ms[2]io[6]A)-hydroxylase [Myxococcales bacterium]